MAPVLYMLDLSPPVRSVLMTAKSIGLNLEHKEIDLINNHHLEPEYLQMNPQHTVPTLNDNGFVIWDSHVIMVYLMEKYSKNSPLYPTEPEKRAVINQRLHFDNGVLFPVLIGIAKPIKLGLRKDVPKEKIDAGHEAYGFLEKFLEGQQWVAGNTTTIADLSLITTITTLDFFIPIIQAQYPNICAWMKRCESLPYYSENKVGLEKVTAFFKKMIEQ